MLFEDSAAIAGLIVAGVGVWASQAWGDPRIDGAASIVIGVILGIVAALLAREAKGLLIGEGADPAVVAKVRAIVAARPEITAVNHVRTITPRLTASSSRSAPIFAIRSRWATRRR